MALVTGNVTNKHNNYDKVNICVDGKWYSQKQEWWNGPEPEAGDNVEFDDGGRNYIKNFRNKGSAPLPTGSAPTPASSSSPAPKPQGRTFPVGALAPERTINRQNALTNACNIIASSGLPETQDPTEQIIAMARKFEAYTTGDMDMEEAQAAMGELGINP